MGSIICTTFISRHGSCKSKEKDKKKTTHDININTNNKNSILAFRFSVCKTLMGINAGFPHTQRSAVALSLQVGGRGRGGARTRAPCVCVCMYLYVCSLAIRRARLHLQRIVLARLAGGLSRRGLGIGILAQGCESPGALGPLHLHVLFVEHECLVAHAALLRAAHMLADLDTLVQHGLPGHDVFPAADQLAPVARLGGLGEVAFTEDLDIVVGDALGFFRVVEQVFHGGGEIGEVALDFDKVLIRAVAAEEVVVVLDPLQLVRDDDGAAQLAVFEGARVAASCGC